jgi:hypothetical protein
MQAYAQVLAALLALLIALYDASYQDLYAALMYLRPVYLHCNASETVTQASAPHVQLLRIVLPRLAVSASSSIFYPWHIGRPAHLALQVPSRVVHSSYMHNPRGHYPRGGGRVNAVRGSLAVYSTVHHPSPRPVSVVTWHPRKVLSL